MLVNIYRDPQNRPDRNLNFCVYSRDNKDKESLEYVREMNRKRFAETGEYMTKVWVLHLSKVIAFAQERRSSA